MPDTKSPDADDLLNTLPLSYSQGLEQLTFDAALDLIKNVPHGFPVHARPVEEGEAWQRTETGGVKIADHGQEASLRAAHAFVVQFLRSRQLDIDLYRESEQDARRMRLESEG